MNLRKKLLWVDGLGALLAGAAVLLLSGWLHKWYGLPRELLLFIGVVNLMYGTYSTSLAMRSNRPMTLIVLLVIANLIWTMVCLILATRYWETATFFGIAHLVGEGLFVGGLAFFEWRCREFLRTA